MEDNNIRIHSTLDMGYDFFIIDKWGKNYHFKILTFVVPSGLLSEAFEVIENNFDNEPRVFHILSPFDSDIEKAELQLKGKIKKGINKRYLDYKEGNYSLGDNLEFAGRILIDHISYNDSETDYCFQVDGKMISVEQFLNLLSEVNGFNFKFSIFDTTDEID